MAGTLVSGINRSRPMVIWALIVATAVTATLLAVFALSHTPSRSAATAQRAVTQVAQPTVRQLEPRVAAGRIGQPTVRQLEPRSPGPRTRRELRQLDQDEINRFLNRIGAGSR